MGLVPVLGFVFLGNVKDTLDTILDEGLEFGQIVEDFLSNVEIHDCLGILE